MAGATEDLTPGRRHHVVMQDLLSDARRRLDRLVRLSRDVKKLIDVSTYRDRAYQVAGRAIVGAPEELARLRADMDRMAYVLDDLDRSVIRRELPSQITDALDEDLRRAFRRAVRVLSDEAAREYESQDVFPTVRAFIDAMPEDVQRMHVRESSILRRAALRLRGATRLSEISAGSEDGIHERARTLRVVLRSSHPDLRHWVFEVRGGKTSHMVRIQSTAAGDVSGLADDDVFLACDCGAWRWEGPEFHAKQKDYQEGRPRGTATPPDVRDPERLHMACKHVIAVAKAISARPLPRHLGGEG